MTPTDPLRLRVRIDAAPETVFKALTDPDEMTEWLAESADVDLAAGRYTFWGRYAPRGERPRQTLTAHDEGRRLNFDWAFDTATSTVNIMLSPEDEGTVVEVTHNGLPDAESAALLCFWYVTLANLVAYSEGLQTMPPFDFSVPAQGDALVRTVIDAPVDEVFEFLLNPSQVDKWARGHAVVEPQVGGRYELGWENGPQRILELEPEKVLAYSWQGPETTVRWALRGSRGATYLTLVHSGFDDDAVAEYYRQGWPGYLVEIKRLVELGPRWQPIVVGA
jgi:uncharacterized protein YndB with AHSA1/START domain